MKVRKVPLRSCCVSKEKLEKKDLFRIVKFEDKVFVDETNKANGRGCYLKKDKDIILKAKKSKVLDRSLEIEVPEEIYEKLINLL